MASTIRAEICAAIRELLTEVPPYEAPAKRRADYQILKGEVLDLIAAVSDPCHAAQARELASQARYAARRVAVEVDGGVHGGWI